MPIIKNEFAAVEVEVDHQANGPRLRVEDLETGKTTYLDPLELENLAWVPHRALEPLMDPSAFRWRSDVDEPGSFSSGPSPR